MIKPCLVDADLAKEALEITLELSDYPHAEEHKEIIDCAFIIPCMHKENLAGVCWFFNEGDNPCNLTWHVAVMPEYRSRFFTRKLVNNLLTMLWCMGFEKISTVEGRNLAFRAGASSDENGNAVFTLPHEWRS